MWNYDAKPHVGIGVLTKQGHYRLNSSVDKGLFVEDKEYERAKSLLRQRELNLTTLWLASWLDRGGKVVKDECVARSMEVLSWDVLLST